MNLPTRDWAHAAFEAARRRDTDAEIGALTPLVRDGRHAVDIAMRAWIDRTGMVMDAVCRQRGAVIGPQLETEDYDSGEVTPIELAPAEGMWAARMFMAHRNRDRGMWEALWSAVPADPNAITDHVMALLHAMAATAEAYAQQSRPGPACCVMHAVHADPMLAATRAALSHYN